MKSKPVKGGARIPRQERGKKTREKILKAARGVFSKKGYYGTDSNEIAAEAGVSTGSFYAYFNDKKHVFLETLKVYNKEVAQKAFHDLETSAIRDPEGLIRNLIDRIILAHDLSPRFHREILTMMHSDGEVSAIQSAEEKKIVRFIESLMIRHKEFIRVENTGAAAFLIFKTAESIVHSIKISDVPVNKKELLSELTSMICSYLFQGGHVRAALHGRPR
jgi:AcrR family transcriptional regulator